MFDGTKNIYCHSPTMRESTMQARPICTVGSANIAKAVEDMIDMIMSCYEVFPGCWVLSDVC